MAHRHPWPLVLQRIMGPLHPHMVLQRIMEPLHPHMVLQPMAHQHRHMERQRMVPQHLLEPQYLRMELLPMAMHLPFEKIFQLRILGYHCVTTSILCGTLRIIIILSMCSRMFRPIVVLLGSLFIFCSRLSWALRPYAKLLFLRTLF